MMLFTYIDLEPVGLYLGLASILVGIVFGMVPMHVRAREVSKVQFVSPPCEKAIEEAERTNLAKGHENAGSLSKKAAFSPLVLPRTSLPSHYAPWDQAAASLPHLIRDKILHATMECMPVLDAHASEKLPDQYLQRAATILGILAHAYVRLEGTTSLTERYDSHADVLPKALHLPWTQVCKRLGRAEASLSYIDLVVHNFTTSTSSCLNVSHESLRLLIPTVDNPEEQRFYGTMVEISSRAVPILNQIIEAQRAVLMEDTTALEHSLRAMIPLLRAITTTIHKISMKEGSGFYVDPVVWTKTVANLAIPWLKGVTGAAGTAHPFFHMMDVFTGRQIYDSKIGKEAIIVRSTYPVHWQRFLDALSQVSVRDFIGQMKSKDRAELSNVWASLENVYCGDWGVLGIHRRKVYGYLSVSFRIGRNSTINGLGRGTRRMKWTEADKELETARKDRKLTVLPKQDIYSRPHTLVVYHFSDVIQHNTKAGGYWFVSGDYVYDASSFMSKHPGGRTVIELCSGQDATADLSAVNHLTDPKIRTVLDRYCIGKVRRSVFASPRLRLVYDEVTLLAQRIAEIENTCRVDLTFLHTKMTVLDQPNELTPQKRHHLRETKERIRHEYTNSLASQVDTLFVKIERSTLNCDASKAYKIMDNIQANMLVDTEDLNFQNCDAALGWFEGDLQRLDAMKRMAVTTLQRLESLPFATECLDKRTADAVTDSLIAIGEEVVRLRG